MNLTELIRREPSPETVALWLEKVPYAAYLGMRAEFNGDILRFVLPPQDHLIGNFVLPAIHGGVVAAFMEQSAAFHLVARMDKPVIPKTVNFSTDYLRAVRKCDTFADCTVSRQGRYIANVSVIAWQESPDTPNATGRAHTMVPNLEDDGEE